MKKIQLVESAGKNIAENLAIEEFLWEEHESGCGTLFLWSNPSAVVIGRNQNPWKECSFAAMRAYGTSLARRKTGGGAVYQDEGNLNFSFITDERRYEPEQLCVIVTEALADLGVRAGFGGRNDLLLPDGRKISGLASSDRKGASLIHGTLMIDVDLEKLENCLRVPKEKLSIRGIDSVRMRVANLKEISPDITEQAVKASLRKAWEQAFGLKAAAVCAPADERIGELVRFYRSDAWTYGKKMAFDLCWKKKFRWGLVCLQFQIDRGRVGSVRAESDSLDTDWPDRVEGALSGKLFLRELLEAGLSALAENDPERAEIYEDLCGLVRENL